MNQSEVKWIAGFTSADGTVEPMIKKQSDVSIGYNLSLRIQWSQEPIIAGFFNGDGCILPNIRRRGRGFKINPYLEFDNGDSLVLDELSKMLINLNIKHKIYNDKRDKVKQIRVQKFEMVEKLLNFITPFLVGSKRIQAEIMLQEIIPRMKRGEHRNKIGFLEIMKYIDKLNKLKGGIRGKYNRNFFIEAWNM